MEVPTIIMLTLGLIFLWGGLLFGFLVDDGGFAIAAFSIGFIIPGLANHYRDPGENDIKEGKAHYVIHHVVNIEDNDTTEYSTYRIEWNKGWKYGRPSDD